MRTFTNHAGSVFGYWTAISRVPTATNPTKWVCRCVCGTVAEVQAGHLTSGASTNCGCKRPGNVKHGQATTGQFTKKYKTWRSIKARCNHPNEHNAPYYEGKLCDSWQTFENFDRDVEAPASDDLTIDRIQNHLGYQPGNVRWVTMAEQHRNQSNCVWIEFDGRRQLLSEWARELNINPTNLKNRIEKYGLENALSACKRSST